MWKSAVLVAALSVVGVVCYRAPKYPVPPTFPAVHPWDDLRVTYSSKGQYGGFTRLPRTESDAVAQGYETPPEERKSSAYFKFGVLCPHGDPSVCLLFDRRGNIAGLEIGILKSDVLSTGYPFQRHQSFVPKKRFGRDTFITTLFFVAQDVIEKGGRPDLVAHGTGTGLWWKNGPHGASQIPRFERDLARTPFKKQNCVPGMGLHYYYNMSPALRCEDVEPIFGLYRHGQLIGFGFTAFGKPTPVGKHVWFENMPISTLTRAVPDAPQCLSEWHEAKGHILLHVYFVDKPWDIAC